MDTKLLATKVQIPPLPHRSIFRQRLIDAIENGISHYKLTLLRTPAMS